MAPSSILDNPRYKQKPTLLLFEFYVLDTVAQLSAAKRQGIEQLDMKKLFNAKAKNWKAAVKEVLKFSGTIDVSILDRWYSVKEKSADIDAEKFAQSFADEYFSDRSRVDVWGEGQLEAAKKRIEECRAKGL